MRHKKGSATATGIGIKNQTKGDDLVCLWTEIKLEWRRGTRSVLACSMGRKRGSHHGIATHEARRHVLRMR